MAPVRPAGEVPAIGDVRDFPLPRLLEEVLASQLTGALHFQAGGRRVSLLCEEGMIVGARSTHPESRLGQLLIRAGKITQEQCRDALALKRREPKPLGNLLIDLGLIRRVDLDDVLGRQARERIIDLFRWEDGSYAFAPAASRSGAAAGWRMHPVQAVWEGIRAGSPVDRLKRILQPLSRKLLRRADSGGSWGAPALSPVERRVLEGLDGSATLAEVLNGCGLEGRHALAFFHAALVLGLVEAVDQTPDARPLEGGGAGPARTIREAGAAEPSDLHARLHALAWMVDSRDHYAVLGTEASAPPAAIRTKYLDLAMTLHPDRLDRLTSPALRTLAEAIFSRVAEAYGVLSSPDARSEYDRMRSAPAEFQRKAEEAERAVQAELQYQKGLVYLRKRDFPAAVASFRWAVKLCPGEGEYAGHLGWALHREAVAGGKPSPAESKKLLAEAMRLNAKIDAPYLFLANILKVEGDMAGAEANYEKAVDRNAQCTEALQELRLIRARRAKQGGRGPGRFFR